jgi:hypothetical protein
VRRVLLGILRAVESIVLTVLGVGLVLALLAAVLALFLWLVLR